MPDLIFLAGPNGAGKTTGAFVLLPHVFGIEHFVNADEIARGLSPLAPERAAISGGRIMLEQMRQHLRLRESFALETTLASRQYVRWIADARKNGYRIHLLFIYLNSPELAVARVAQRVASGGHAIETTVIHRRYWAGLRNLITLYIPLSDTWMVINSSAGQLDMVAQGYQNSNAEIVNVATWNQLLRQSQRP